MSLIVTIERTVIPGSQRELTALLRELLAEAIKESDMQSAETVIDLRNPTTFLTITRWSSIAAWEKWEKNPDRLKTLRQVNRLLQGAPIFRYWNESADAPPPAG